MKTGYLFNRQGETINTITFLTDRELVALRENLSRENNQRGCYYLMYSSYNHRYPVTAEYVKILFTDDILSCIDAEIIRRFGNDMKVVSNLIDELAVLGELEKAPLKRAVRVKRAGKTKFFERKIART